MIIVLSPAKTLDLTPWNQKENYTFPDFLQDSQELVDHLAQLSEGDLASLMKLSPKLAELNHQRYQDWKLPFTLEVAKPALRLFKGDVYVGLQAESLQAEEVQFAQQHLRILSGLYGLLRPLDLMLPYRLEMGTRLETQRGKNLYAFWGNRITENLNEQLQQQEQPVLINLASNEYFKALRVKSLKGKVITPIFKDYKNGKYKVISFYAKRARGLMARHLLTQRITQVEKLKSFTEEGYGFDPVLSTETDWVFTRNIENHS
ncbi:MAG: peroxide stress protein YaaA [SAR324 cluster bacterium]|uniref:UPF0246 protein COB67_09190 n=1 Tax=SAR324 cluster bacterium TaxID=2024889 RepID=A0A2A4T2E5_9DELT|nr:MAG: peroxide stress protein YaaA [SAR324 cluster bacterium]